MKRRAFKLLPFLLAIVGGAIINVAVAWGFLNIVPVWDLGMFGPDTSNSEQEAWWRAHRPVLAMFGPEGLSMGKNQGALMEHIYPFDESPDCVTAIRASAGWPMYSLVGGLW